MGLTQEGLAVAIQKTPESISNIERSLQLPSIETLLDLGRVLEVSPAELLEDDVSTNVVSPQRQALELQLREIGRVLRDEDLQIVIDQADVIRVARGKAEMKESQKERSSKRR